MRTDCPDCTWHIKVNGGIRTVTGYKPCDECRMATLHDLRLKIDHTGATELVEAGTITQEQARALTKWQWPTYSNYCFRCSKDMRARAVHTGYEFPTTDRPFDPAEELQNEATLIFSGGYGSFIDDLGEMPSLQICHECAHELCEWLGVDPRNWHTHSVHGGQHADHHDNRQE